jgi:glutamyl-Q tRNA(Asp) synthetase
LNPDKAAAASVIGPSTEPCIGPTSAPPATTGAPRYRGRFAPSPTGPLHAGSLVAALASWLDARAHGGTWLVRIEDLDPPREAPGAAQDIIDTLAGVDLVSDEPALFQSTRGAAYADALARLRSRGMVFGCTCSRRDVMLASGETQRYPGTCRDRKSLQSDAVAWRLRVTDEPIEFHDRAAGLVAQRLESDVGDFVLRRADGLWAYQLAVVVDDAAQGITDVVRGADLLENTPRQIWLQRQLGVPTPEYLHVPVMTNDSGDKLSKQTGAQPLDRARPLVELERAWAHLGFAPLGADSVAAFLAAAVPLWRNRRVAADRLSAVTPTGRDSDGR